ncbi:BC1881 family protein [Paenibacillus sp. NRS-1783]|uniref:BC1881 family protein n=1 Tax=Paenibacillus sp. NRS-1783 TaxID=3233907 RepID=UPI003D2CD0F3
MAKYRKKPLVVDAIQFDGKNYGDISDFCGGETLDTYQGKVGIDTPGGTVWVDKGNYIINGVAGELYPCKPDVFRLTYEEVKQMPNANIVDHIGSIVTVWTKCGNIAEHPVLRRADDFGVVISYKGGEHVFIPWEQVEYIDYPNTSPESVTEIYVRKLSKEKCEAFKRMWETREDRPVVVPHKINPNTGRTWLLQFVSTKALSDELRTRAGVKVLELSPEDTLNAITLRNGRYHSDDLITGPAVVLFNQD